MAAGQVSRRGKLGIHAMLLASVAMWGLVFIGVHELLPVMDPFQLATIRFTMSAAAYAALLAATPSLRPRLSRSQWRQLLVLAVFAVPGSQLAVLQGQRYLSPALAALVMSSSPAIAAVAAVVLLGERLTLRKTVGLGVALVGVVTIIVFGAGTGADLSVTNPWGGGIVLLSAASWGVYTVLSKAVAARHPPLGAVAVVIVLGTVMLLPLAPHALSAVDDLGAREWAWMVYLAVGGSFLPYLVWMHSLRYLEAGQTVAYMYLVPVFALLWSLAVLGTVPTLTALAGGVAVILGVALAQVGGGSGAPAGEPAPAQQDAV